MDEKLKTFFEIFVMVAIISALFWLFITTDLKKRHDEIFLEGYNQALEKCKDVNFWIALQNEGKENSYPPKNLTVNLTFPLILMTNFSTISQQSQVR